MELVKGQPITRYCDEKRLGVRERLELFGDVCRAVQHAHQKGVIHRDIKPSNVLVAPYDGKPVVKMIDFGVAKATGQLLTDKTLFTGFGALVGTPEYMSPEQAEVNNPVRRAARTFQKNVRSVDQALGLLTQCAEDAGLSDQNGVERPFLRLPQPHGSVRARGNGAAALGGKPNAFDAILMTTEYAALHAAFQVPQAHGMVLAPG
jgi:serine/threonine protein kinase